MLELMIRILMVSGFATVAAWLFERALASMKLPVRHAWTFALIASSVLPFVPPLLTTSYQPPVISQFTLPAIVLSAGETGTNYSRLFWIVLSIVAVIVYAIAYVRLQMVRRAWKNGLLCGEPVLFANDYGPAVFGLVKPRIVVPHWIDNSSHDEQRLIVLHEREHIIANDHLLLWLSLVVTAIMPWNPFVWIQTRKLRFAVEADCDQRVLAEVPDRARYATLLVDVGSRQSTALLMPALAEHRNGLERRLHMMGETVMKNKKKAALFVSVGAIVTIVSCESRLPTDAKIEDAKTADAKTVLVEKILPTKILDGVALPLRRSSAPGEPAFETEKDGNWVLDVKEMRPTMREAYKVPGNKIPDYKPSPEGSKTFMRVMTDQPGYTPYTDKPELANREQVQRALVEAYPPLLRDAGIGGTTLTWILVSERGEVIGTKVSKTSGRTELDQAALKVAKAMKFTAAKNNGTAVPVWIQLPIVLKPE